MSTVHGCRDVSDEVRAIIVDKSLWETEQVARILALAADVAIHECVECPEEAVLCATHAAVTCLSCAGVAQVCVECASEDARVVSLSPQQRADHFRWLRSRYCLACGSALPCACGHRQEETPRC